MATSIFGPTRLAPEAALVEGDLLAEHVVDSPSQLGGEDAHRLGRPALLLLLLLPASGPLALPQNQTGRLPESPAQVRGAALLPPRALRLASRDVGTTDQAGVAEEVADVGKAADVVDLVEQHQGEDLADAGQRLQAVVALHVVDLGSARQVQLDIAEQLVVAVDQGEI